jgi:uncharacterized membrane protein (DUF2068 family)
VLEKFSLDKAVSTTHLSAGIRTIAIFEALKGILVLAAGFGLLSLVDHDLQAAAERLVRLSHLDPAHHYPRVFIEASANLNDARLRLLAALAFLYAGGRFIEAYGLWRMRAWAEWLAIVSGAVYLPVEVFELIKHATLMRGGVLLINAGIVVYLVYFRWLNRKSHTEIGCGLSTKAYIDSTRH